MKKKITFDVFPLKKDINSVVDHFEVKFSQPVSAQWLWYAIHDAIKLSEEKK